MIEATPLVVHLFVSEDRLVDGIPIHVRLLLVGQSRLVELQEEPLRPLVVFRIACTNFLKFLPHYETHKFLL